MIRGLIAFLVAVLLGFLVASAHGQDKQTMKPADLKTPVVPDSLQKDFFKAYGEALKTQMAFQQAQDAAKRAQEAMQAVLAKVNKVCEPMQPQTNAAGDLECVKKPEAPKPEVKK